MFLVKMAGLLHPFFDSNETFKKFWRWPTMNDKSKLTKN